MCTRAGNRKMPRIISCRMPGRIAQIFGRLSEFNWGYGLLKFGRGDNSVYLHKETQGGFVRKGDDLIWGPLGHNFSKIMGDNFHIKENFTLLPNYLHTHTIYLHTHTFLWILIITPLFC